MKEKHPTGNHSLRPLPAKEDLEALYYEYLHNNKKVLTEERSASLLAQLHAAIRAGGQEEKAGNVTRWNNWFKWSVAAAVIVLAGAVYVHYQPAAPMPVAVVPPAPVKDSSVVLRNDTKDDLEAKLADGSAIKLSPGSSVRYYEPFAVKRDISLLGKALFTVQADPAHPFTVYAGDIATTVLGTQFMVSTRTVNKVKVRLFSGRVVVRSTSGALSLKDVYLSPGELFSIDKELRQFKVERFKQDGGHAKRDAQDVVPVTNAPLEFTQAPLTQVLSDISQRYHVHFVFDQNTFNEERVTGKFLPGDSLESVLSMLQTISGLSFEDHQDTIIVSKLK